MNFRIFLTFFLVITALPAFAGWKEDYRAALNNQNDARALKIVNDAVDRGDAEAEFTLGLLYHSGQGVIQNNEQAYAWMLVGIENGFKQGNGSVEFLGRKMSPLKVENAKKIAAEIKIRGRK